MEKENTHAYYDREYIYDRDKLKKYEKWVLSKRHGISRKTAKHYARMMIRAEDEGLTTVDEVSDKYWSRGHTVRTGIRNGVRLRKELAEDFQSEIQRTEAK